MADEPRHAGPAPASRTVDVGAHELPCRQLDLDVTVLAQVRDPCHGAAQRIDAGAAPSLTAEGRMHRQAAPPAPAWLRSSPCRTLSPTRKAPWFGKLAMQLVVGADERGDKRVGRPREHIDGAVELLHLPGLHDGDLIGGDQRFALVVRDIDRGQAQKIVHLADLVAHLLAQMRIEIGQGFVQQEGCRARPPAPAPAQPAALSAGELRRIALRERREADRVERAFDPLLSELRAGHLCVPAGHRRRSRRPSCAGHTGVVLEHQRDIAPLGRHHDARARNLAIADPYLAVGRLVEARSICRVVDLPQPEGLSSASSSPLGQLQIDAAQNLVCAIVLGKTFDANCPHDVTWR